MSQNIEVGKLVIPEKTPEPEARQILFDARPVCDQCERPIASLEECVAVLFCGRGLWKLTHRQACLGEAVLLPWNPSGISARQYRRRFA